MAVALVDQSTYKHGYDLPQWAMEASHRRLKGARLRYSPDCGTPTGARCLHGVEQMVVRLDALSTSLLLSRCGGFAPVINKTMGIVFTSVKIISFDRDPRF